jgi:hypothetical protein
MAYPCVEPFGCGGYILPLRKVYPTMCCAMLLRGCFKPSLSLEPAGVDWMSIPPLC